MFPFYCGGKMSGKRDLNPRHPPWQGGALPLSYSRLIYKYRAVIITHHTGKVNENFPFACIPMGTCGKV